MADRLLKYWARSAATRLVLHDYRIHKINKIDPVNPANPVILSTIGLS